MKKLALTIVCTLAVASGAFAQGTIQWFNSGANVIAVTNGNAYSPLFGGGLAAGPNTGTTGNVPTWNTEPYYYTLLYTTYTGSLAANPTTESALNSWLPAWNASVYATNFNISANGRLNFSVANDTGQTVNWANGTTESIMVVGWSGNLGSTWGAVSNMLANWSTLGSEVVGNAFFGESATGFVNPGTVNPGPVIFGVGSGLISNPSGSPMNLYLLPVPEPTTIALAGLGGLSLLLFRRRKV